MTNPLQSMLMLAALSCLGLSACQRGNDAPAGHTAVSAPLRVFSADDRRAARALSIGNGDSLTRASGPYQQALLCDASITAVAQRLEQGGALGRAQVQLFDVAAGIYHRRADVLAQQQRRNAVQMDNDRQQALTLAPDLATKGQVAIGCLRQLQPG